ncbi:efflux RND transporter periplasmic adaptor subunit [Allochromatium palmeri]|uniref:Efflux RND transporter periplasmic adaptor subunit n=1 Tax=Allochromatium palmeri TaxID=231048 RepID=A0A6N8EC78_9GAMM|nr:efflux RND transporter periplasmic adaptor subunit [Allochromatium palmeri]MTW20216.1 efflux RND transporter periplasmic adaptor subunit [Allochromatium palmeri]
MNPLIRWPWAGAWLGVLMAAFAVVGCERSTPPGGGAGGPGGHGGPPPEVGVITLQTREAALTTELPGRTTSYRVAEVRPQVGGLIKERLFKEGALIRSGQVLYQIDPAVYQSTYDSAQAALNRSRATFERARLKAERYANLVKAKAVSQEDFDDAEAALKEAAASVAVDEAELARARIDLEYTRVTAPIGGRIGRSVVTQGALVTANQELALATLQQLDPIYVDLTQSSAQMLGLRRALEDGRLQRPDGDQPRVTLVLEDGSDYPLAGRLEFSEVSVDPGTGAVTLRATFPNPDHVLLPGMFVRARVEEGTRPEAVLAPQRGVQRDRRGQPYALVLNAEGVVEQRMLKTDRTLGSDWLIDDGLAPGDRLIIDGLQKVRPGDKAQPVVLDDQPPEAASGSGTTH